MPKENIGPLYEYLLKENYDLDSLTFSIDRQNIMLSTIVFDEDLNEETGKVIFQELFKKADEYDNYLADKFGMQMAENG